jgi:hypothetical protein
MSPIVEKNMLLDGAAGGAQSMKLNAYPDYVDFSAPHQRMDGMDGIP